MTSVDALFAEAERLLDARPRTDDPEDPTVGGTLSDEVIDRLRAAERPVVLAGPGVVHHRAVSGLHALATSAHLGVLNTWGAKGIFDWQSPHHLATVGLQEHDFMLGGLGDADVIVATGVDPDEAGGDRWKLAPVVEVAPQDLQALAHRWQRAPGAVAVPPLRVGLGRVTQDGWASTTVPMVPSLATRILASDIGRTGLLAADAGTAGYWVARTFATSALGTVVVPARVSPGLAVACAAVARLRDPDRPVLAIVDGPPTGAVLDVLEAATARGANVAVECWQDDGEALDADHYAERLSSLVRTSTSSIVTLAIAERQRTLMVDVAGPIIAWPGLDMPRS